VRRNKVLWTAVLVVSIILLIGYGIWEVAFLKSRYNGSYNQGYNNVGMMGKWFSSNRNQFYNTEKLTIDQIKLEVNNNIQRYASDLEVSDIFVYKDTDYYVSIKEKDTGRGAMEILVNPYTGQTYPEYGPNIVWNEKYDMRNGYGMMGGTARNNYSRYSYSRGASERVNKEEAVKAADEYVKSNISKELSVSGTGYEFYGYYTFHINNDNKIVGMISVNYYTGEVWYHNWHGELEQVISDKKE